MACLLVVYYSEIHWDDLGFCIFRSCLFIVFEHKLLFTLLLILFKKKQLFNVFLCYIISSYNNKIVNKIQLKIFEQLFN